MFCPSCGTQNKPDVEYCDRCGERVAAPDIERVPRTSLAKCTRCGTVNHVRAPHCYGCGIVQDQTTAIPLLAISETPPRPAPRAPRSEQRPIPPHPPVDDRPKAGFRPPPGPEPATEPDGIRSPEAAAQPAGGVNDSGSRGAVLPVELKGWNWGAFLLGPIWGVFNRVWITLVLLAIWLLPVVPQWLVGPIVFAGLGFYVYLGLKGNELAWRGKRWNSPEHFRRVQQLWATWGLIITIAELVLLLVTLTAKA